MDLEAAGRRRRGQELEDAILAAAWERLVTAGYGNFTIDAVAEAAGTSRSVLYRRWPDRDSLVQAALAHGLAAEPIEVPDTGSLREDVLALFRAANAPRASLVPVVSVLMGSYFSPDGPSFADVRAQLLTGRVASMDVVLDRAAARGEIDPERLTPRVRRVALDLIRHDLLMTLKPLPDAEILAIVDEVLLPLVRWSGPPVDRTAQRRPASGEKR